MKVILALVLAYLVGSIPFGYIMGKLFKHIDIREYGSGNIGTANAFRVFGPPLALLVLLGDVGKGLGAIYLMRLLNINHPSILAVAGLAVIIGHDWSIFLGFKGGKGVAATFGVIAAFNLPVAILGGAIWLVLTLLTKYASLASISSLTTMLIFMILFKQPREYVILSIILLLLTVIRHRENLRRLRLGEERKISDKIEIKKKE